MDNIRTVKELIDLWPSREALASSLAAKIGCEVKVSRVHKWAQNGSIPQEFMGPFLSSCESEGYLVDALELVAAHAKVDLSLKQREAAN